MEFDILLAEWKAVQHDARAVRTAVFIHEQQVPVELEWDDFDHLSIHSLARDSEGRAVATARLLPDGHIGRMAVLRPYRGQGIGSAMLQALVRRADERGDAAVLLHAQRHAEAFYRRHGFIAVGAEFMEAGIPHIQMRRILAAS